MKQHQNKKSHFPLLIIPVIFGMILFSSCARKFMVVEEPSKMPPARVLETPPRVALVLGGGAFHGAAHVGVIKVLEDEDIPIDLIVGTSAGSMVGAFYADNPHVDSLIPLVNDIKARDVFDFSLFRSSEGFVSGKRLQKYINEHVHAKNVEDTRIPFVAVTTDMNSGKSVPLAAGPLAASVNASCAIPYIFEPVQMYGTLFSDGGIINNVATDVAKAYKPVVIIAVDVMAYWDSAPDLKNKTEVLYRAFTVASRQLHKKNERYADILITPDLKSMPLMSARDNEQMFKAGIKAAREMMPELRELLILKNLIK